MQKDEKLNITKEKLLDATFALMEETDDPLNVTSRQIAERAGAKPSMINYCFGSRENLIYQTFQKQYLNFLEDKEIAKLIASDMPCRKPEIHKSNNPLRSLQQGPLTGFFQLYVREETLCRPQDRQRVQTHRV